MSDLVGNPEDRFSRVATQMHMSLSFLAMQSGIIKAFIIHSLHKAEVSPTHAVDQLANLHSYTLRDLAPLP